MMIRERRGMVNLTLDLVVDSLRKYFYYIITYKIKRGLSPISLEPATRLSRTLQPQPPSPAQSVSLHLEKKLDLPGNNENFYGIRPFKILGWTPYETVNPTFSHMLCKR